MPAFPTLLRFIFSSHFFLLDNKSYATMFTKNF